LQARIKARGTGIQDTPAETPVIAMPLGRLKIASQKMNLE
jgi:hypothetical protein